MKILFLTNNSNTKPLVDFLKNDKYNNVIEYSDKISLNVVKNIEPDITISYNYLSIISQSMIDYLKNRIINLHISLLPLNRGFDPNLWSWIKNTKKGVSIHLIDSGIDTGDILLQEELFMGEYHEYVETLYSSYNALHRELQKLFVNNWDKIKNFDIDIKPQEGNATLHYRKEAKKIRKLYGNHLWHFKIYILIDQLESLGLI